MESFVAIFIILHGLVHLLYFGQSMRYFELRPGMTWPAGSWFFSAVFHGASTKRIVAGLCVIAALLFVLAGSALLISWFSIGDILLAGILVSSILFILAWNGKSVRLDDQGAFALLINAGLLLISLTGYLS